MGRQEGKNNHPSDKNPHMPLVKISGLTVFRFNNLSRISWLHHGVSTRDSGNLDWEKTSDKKEVVLENRKRFLDALGVEKEVVEMQQVHGNHVAVVGSTDKGHTILGRDALITKDPRVSLFIKTADCVPILLVDPVKHVIGAVHAGWRGTAQEIARLTIQHMEDHFGTNPKDILAGIGPSIGPCCYEVDTPVIEAFKKFSYADKIFSPARNATHNVAGGKKQKDHVHLDLWRANKIQLIETGVKEEHIEIAEFCTRDSPELFFSERREKPSGRFG
ncbi:peptidoglycan editing factor PgeF, partial [Candidatus Microgenomates bacterium]|nr:peptidoglycan editing factor PgeF [Candidatus Microgenomates bacterium]